MFDWLKSLVKEYPDFWKEYLSKFDKKSKRFVAISCESSGLNPDIDVIFSLACIAIEDNGIVVQDSIELGLLQNLGSISKEKRNAFLRTNLKSKLTEPEAIKLFIDYLGNAVLVGHRIYNDVEMINKALHQMDCGRLKNEALDIEVMENKLQDTSDKLFTLEELAEIHKIPKSERYSSSDDAYTIALLFLKLKSKLDIK
jgi:DNA polymerase III subunit epsilon